MKQKQRAVIKSLIAGRSTVADFYKILENMNVKLSTDEITEQRWMKKFKEGETNVEDKPHNRKQKVNHSMIKIIFPKWIWQVGSNRAQMYYHREKMIWTVRLTCYIQNTSLHKYIIKCFTWGKDI